MPYVGLTIILVSNLTRMYLKNSLHHFYFKVKIFTIQHYSNNKFSIFSDKTVGTFLNTLKLDQM